VIFQVRLDRGHRFIRVFFILKPRYAIGLNQNKPMLAGRIISRVVGRAGRLLSFYGMTAVGIALGDSPETRQESHMGVPAITTALPASGRLPKAVTASAENSPAPIDRATNESEPRRWVELEGVVTFVSERASELELEVRSGADRVQVVVTNRSGLPAFVFSNGRVQVQGWCRAGYTVEGHKVPSVVVAAALQDIRLLEVTPRVWDSYPLIAIGDLLRTNLVEGAEPIVHVTGKFRSATLESKSIIEDSSGSLEVTGPERLLRPVGVQVEVLGIWRREGAKAYLRCAVCRSVSEGGPQAAAPLPVLTTVEQVKGLKREEAQRGYPVLVRGVVTCVRTDFRSVVLQDLTRGIYVNFSTLPDFPLPRVQEYWEIEGVSDPGGFAPIIRVRQATRLGDGRLPEPLHPTWDQIMNGSLDTQYVELQGVIIDVLTNGIMLLTRSGKIKVELPDTPAAIAQTYQTALVRLRGCLFPGWIGQTRQVSVGEVLLYNVSIDADEPMPVSPFAAPAKSPVELRLFDLEANVFQRTKVFGQLLHRSKADCWLTDGTNGLRFNTRQGGSLRPGDLVEVAGYPELGGPSPVLQEAAVRKLGSAPLPKPPEVPANDLLNEDHDSTLVRVKALLVELRNDQEGQVLELQAGLITFLARLKGRSEWVKTIPNGTKLELTGVYAAYGGNKALGQRLSSFELLLNYASDIKILERPSWWTFPRVLSLLEGLMVLLLLGILWVFTLKRRVNKQTIIIRQQVERQATLEERARIAREFHDTLEQALVGLGMQLNALAGTLRGVPQEALRILGVALSMVRHSQEEARRAVRNLRTLELDQGDLPTAVSLLVAQARNSWPGQIKVQISGTPRRLSARIENHLLRICQEGTNNAIKHANPKSIRLELEFAPDSVRLSIIDDGRGFDIESSAPGAVARFGLLGMRERAEKLGGTLVIQSAPEAGTSVYLILPLANRPPKSDLYERKDSDSDS
jgi:signal transduction histidine kinase